MKIVFLDIDGVLNNAYTKERFQQFTGIDSRLAVMYHRWAHKNQDVSTVLSSTWRLEEPFRDEVKLNGIHFIDVTPDLRSLGRKRGSEIQEWLDKHPEVTSYVILDDYGADMFLPDQRRYLVQTSEVKGLEEKKLRRMEELLSLGDNHGTESK